MINQIKINDTVLAENQLRKRSSQTLDQGVQAKADLKKDELMFDEVSHKFRW